MKWSTFEIGTWCHGSVRCLTLSVRIACWTYGPWTLCHCLSKEFSSSLNLFLLDCTRTLNSQHCASGQVWALQTQIPQHRASDSLCSPMLSCRCIQSAWQWLSHLAQWQACRVRCTCCWGSSEPPVIILLTACTGPVPWQCVGLVPALHKLYGHCKPQPHVYLGRTAPKWLCCSICPLNHRPDSILVFCWSHRGRSLCTTVSNFMDRMADGPVGG